MAIYTCPVCAEVFDTAGHPDPARLTCFNCNQRADEPGYGYDRTGRLAAADGASGVVFRGRSSPLSAVCPGR